MISVTVLYPYHVNKKFDSDYYASSHIPLIKTALGSLLKDISYELGVSRIDPTSPPSFFCIFHMKFESLEDLAAASPNIATFIADLENFTDTQPIIQISEVKL